MMEGESGIRQKTQRPLPGNGNSNGADLRIAMAASLHSRRVLGLKPDQSVATLRGIRGLNQRINPPPTAPLPPKGK